MNAAPRTAVSRLRQLLRPRSQRWTHSVPPKEYSSPADPFNATEGVILSSSMHHVPRHGFTVTSLALGAKDSGYVDASTNLFPEGPVSLVHYHLVSRRRALARKQILLQQSCTTKPIGVGEKVKVLTWERLQDNKEIIHKWQDALALLAIPSNAPLSFRELGALADEIWFLAGDKSVDTSWYTKRFLLSAIYASTELFMTTDTSSGFSETRLFLDRRFEDNFKIGRLVGRLTQWTDFTSGAVLNILRSKGVRV